jgi:hypothetical protein
VPLASGAGIGPRFSRARSRSHLSAGERAPPASAQRSGPALSHNERNWPKTSPANEANMATLASALFEYLTGSTMPLSSIARTRWGNMLA